MHNKYFLFFFFIAHFTYAQISSQSVSISETVSSNREFKIKSVSYDNAFPNLIGQSTVYYLDEYENGFRKKFYQIPRSFDMWGDYPFFTAISNDGRKILYLKNVNYYDGNEHKDVTYYVDGKLEKFFTGAEFTSCDRTKEKCDLFYDNKDTIYKNFYVGTAREFNEKADEKEKFLAKNYVFNKNDTVYVIDARKRITLFDLDKGTIIKSNLDFDSLYPKIKNIEAIRSNISYYDYPYRKIFELVNEQTQKKLPYELAKIHNLQYKPMDSMNTWKYRFYKIDLEGLLDKNGKFTILKLKADPKLDEQKIRNYLAETKFETNFIPTEVDKIFVGLFWGGFRNRDEKIALQEREAEIAEQKLKHQERLKAEKIAGFYIPKNLYECLTELDRILDFENKKELREAKSLWQFNGHMGGLGMWIRNNWGINGGSRLQKYFNDRNIGVEMMGNEEISEIIIQEYVKWLKGDKQSWKKWEKSNPRQ